MCRKTGLEKDNVIFDWILLMLQEDPQKRPTAATLHHDIGLERAKRGVQYCGSCCLENTESSGIEDELWDLAAELTVTERRFRELS
jgi:hypothetical protein